MSVKFFRNVISNLCIGLVIVTVTIVAFGSTAAASYSTASPIYKINGGDKVCLMVNVYWGDEYLDKMLQIFDRHSVKTTFFVGGMWANKNEETLKKIYARGHEIGNHGYFHKDHKKLNEIRNREEIGACHNLIKSILGIEMKYFSPPSASFSSITLDVAEKIGYTTIMYSRDTIDWRDHDAELIYRRATKNIVGGELVLMHPTAATIEALDAIITEIKSNGLIPTTISEVISSKSGDSV